MRETQAVEDLLAESLMEYVTLGQTAEGLADQVADSLADSLDVGAHEHDGIAEALSHLGCGPDEIGDILHTLLTGLAAGAALKLAREPLPEGMPPYAVVALGKVLAAARREAS